MEIPSDLSSIRSAVKTDRDLPKHVERRDGALVFGKRVGQKQIQRKLKTQVPEGAEIPASALTEVAAFLDEFCPRENPAPKAQMLKKQKRATDPKPLPDQSLLLELLRYNPKTGLLYWRKRFGRHFHDDNRVKASARARMWNGRCAGKEAFSRTTSRGYKAGSIQGQVYLAHRVIWKMVTGVDPEIIDHINGDQTDNRFENLRSTTHGGNARNQRIPHTNTSGAIGVTVGPGGRFRACVAGVYLGSFDTTDEASEAVSKAHAALGFHENHGRTDHT